MLAVSGTGTLDENSIVTEVVDGEWNVSFTAAGRFNGFTDSFVVLVYTDTPATIRHIRVESNRYNDEPTSAVFIVVKSLGGALLGVEEIEQVSLDNVPDGLFGIYRVATDQPIGTSYGNLGTGGSTPGGFVKAHYIGDLSVAGNITAQIQSLSLPQGWAGSHWSFQSIVAVGSILNDISNGIGSIGEVRTENGDIGTLGQAVSITAAQVILVVAAQNIYASISTGSTFDGPSLQLVSAAGAFTGAISTPQLDAIGTGPTGLIVGGLLNGNFSIPVVNSPIAVGNISSTSSLTIFECLANISIGDSLRGKISIGHSLTGNLSISGTGGLKGQVIVNADNYDPGVWTGSVSVGGTALSPIPLYTQTSSALGGGSVGMGPFDLHSQDCSPANGTTVSGGASYVRVSHYGPVKGEGPYPIKVEYRANSGSGWVDKTAATDQFQHPGGVLRDILVVPAQGSAFSFKNAGDYRLTPVRSGANVLVCSGVLTEPPVAAWTYTMTVP